jgi:hypothetical protein
MKISVEEMTNCINQLRDMRISLPWKGYGSTIFLELGKLQEKKTTRSYHPEGEACVSVTWDWRIEKENKILFGSSNSGPEIDEEIKLLEGEFIEEIGVEGQIPELLIKISNGMTLRTMAALSGDPQWTIKLLDSNYLSWEDSDAVIRTGDESGPGNSDEEKELMALTEKVAERWGRPSEEGLTGNCEECKYFIRIDGNYNLLDYGACVNEMSKYDGRVVKCDSGCTKFLKE